MNRYAAFAIVLCTAVYLCAAPAEAAAPPPTLRASMGLAVPDAKTLPDLFVWGDTCQVYVLRDGDAALLDRPGRRQRSRSPQRHRREARRVGALHAPSPRAVPRRARLKDLGTKLAAPEGERKLFEQPADFRKMKVRLGDALTIHGSSYVRPPIQPIALDRVLKPGDTFRWRGYELACVSTPGNSPAAMTYVLQHERPAPGLQRRRHARRRPHAYLVRYGMGLWVRRGHPRLAEVRGRADRAGARVALPSHGPIVRDPKPQLRQYAEKLERLEKLYVRGYDVGAGSIAYQDKVSKPTPIADVVQVSPHLFKFKRKDFWPNFGLILADSGRGLVVDCGLLDIKFLDASLDGLRKHYGLKAIDAVIITHMHGDHFLQAPHLREKWGAKIWALDNMVDKMEHPERFDYAAPIQAYGRGSTA